MTPDPPPKTLSSGTRQKLHPIAAILLLALPGLVSGCVFFHVPYDDVSQEYIRELEQRTREVVATGDRGRLSLKESRRFLQQSQAQAGILRIRARLNKEALRYLDEADRSYAALLQRQAPIRTANTVELRTALSHLHALGLHHGVWVSSPGPNSPPDNNTDDIPDAPPKKDCDRKDDHHHKDKDHKDKDRDDRDHHKHD
jgi:hypothetical protein